MESCSGGEELKGSIKGNLISETQGESVEQQLRLPLSHESPA